MKRLVPSELTVSIVAARAAAEAPSSSSAESTSVVVLIRVIADFFLSTW
jgi:hypothetical protein